MAGPVNDQAGSNESSGGTTTSIDITTGAASTLIVLACTVGNLSSSTSPGLTVTTTGGLTWTAVDTTGVASGAPTAGQNGGPCHRTQMWWALATHQLTAETIEITSTQTIDDASTVYASFLGTSLGVDVNSGAIVTTFNVSPNRATISSTAADASAVFVLGCNDQNSPPYGVYGTDAVWLANDQNNDGTYYSWLAIGYQQFHSPQSGVTVGFDTSRTGAGFIGLMIKGTAVAPYRAPTNGFITPPFAGALTSHANPGTRTLYLTKITLSRSVSVEAVLINTAQDASGMTTNGLIYDSAHSVKLGQSIDVVDVGSHIGIKTGYNRLPFLLPVSLAAGDYYIGVWNSFSLNLSVDSSHLGNSWVLTNVTTIPNPITSGSGSGFGNLLVALEFGSPTRETGFAPDNSSGITLSGTGNEIATGSSTAGSARSIATVVPGVQSYCEVAVSGTVPSDALTTIGVCTVGGFPMGSPDFANHCAQVMASNGNLRGTYSAGAGLSYTSGDVIGIAYDSTIKGVWFNKNGGTWRGAGGASGDPAAGTNPIDIHVGNQFEGWVPGNWPVAIYVSADAATVFTLHDTAASQVYTPPAGFTSFVVPPPPPTTSGDAMMDGVTDVAMASPPYVAKTYPVSLRDGVIGRHPDPLPHLRYHLSLLQRINGSGVIETAYRFRRAILSAFTLHDAVSRRLTFVRALQETAITLTASSTAHTRYGYVLTSPIGVQLTQTPTWRAARSLVQNLTVHSATSLKFIWGRGLTEALNVSATLSARGQYRLALAQLFKFTEVENFKLRHPVVLNQNVNLSLSLVGKTSIKLLQKFLVATAASPAFRYHFLLTSRVIAQDILEHLVKGVLAELFTVHSALGRHFTANSSLAQLLTIHPALNTKLVLKIVGNIQLSPTQLMKMIYRGDPLLDGVVITALYISPSGTTTTWVVNTRTNAVTEYLNYDFRSFAQMGNRYVAAGAEGLYELDGDTDDGASIIADMMSGYLQLNEKKMFGIKGAYVAIRGGGRFYLKLISGDGREYVYELRAQPNLMTTKVKVGKGIRTTYMAFELVTEGQDFDLDSIEFIPMTSGRRV